MDAATPIIIKAIFMSIIFHHYQVLKDLREKAIELGNNGNTGNE